MNLLESPVRVVFVKPNEVTLGLKNIEQTWQLNQKTFSW